MQHNRTLALELLASVTCNWRNLYMNTVMILIKIIWRQKDLIQLKNAELLVKVDNKLL